MITTNDVKREFKSYNITENQAGSIVQLYTSAAKVIAEVAGEESVLDSPILKTVMVAQKAVVAQILELSKNAKKQRGGPREIPYS